MADWKSHGDPALHATGDANANGAGLWDGREASAAAKESEQRRAGESGNSAVEGAASSGPLTDADVLAARTALHGASGSAPPPDVRG